jgi:hypothetical protein
MTDPQDTRQAFWRCGIFAICTVAYLVFLLVVWMPQSGVQKRIVADARTDVAETRVKPLQNLCYTCRKPATRHRTYGKTGPRVTLWFCDNCEPPFSVPASALPAHSGGQTAVASATVFARLSRQLKFYVLTLIAAVLYILVGNRWCLPYIPAKVADKIGPAWFMGTVAITLAMFACGFYVASL